MLDVTYRDYRYFMRLLTSRAQLWTEMVVDNTLIFNAHSEERMHHFLGFDDIEHPIVCQLGGSDPSSMAEAAVLAESYGYNEVNINVGCPSSRVACKGEFGASLMKKPELVRDIVHSISRQVQIPVTVKTRLGVDDMDTPEFTRHFVETVRAGGCQHFIMHARKCWLKGLSPAQNRSIPPLDYARVRWLCDEFPDLDFSLNGGIETLQQAEGILHDAPSNMLGVMMGRATYQNPCLLWDVDRRFYGEEQKPKTRRSLLEKYADYLQDRQDRNDTSVKTAHLAMKPTLGVFHKQVGCRFWRSCLDAYVREKRFEDGPSEMLRAAIVAMDEKVPGLLDDPLYFEGFEPDPRRFLPEDDRTKKIYSQERNSESCNGHEVQEKGFSTATTN